MDLQNFVTINKGEVLDNGLGGFKGECVSLDWQFANEVQHVPLGVLYCSNTGGARDLYEQFDGKIPQYYDRIPKDQLQTGDIVVWGGAMGPLGHTAVKIDGPSLTVFEQMAGVSPRVRTYTNLNGVLGGLRLKGEDMILDESMFRRIWSLNGFDVGPSGRQPSAKEISEAVGREFNEFIDYWITTTPVKERIAKGAFYDQDVAAAKAGAPVKATPLKPGIYSVN